MAGYWIIVSTAGVLLAFGHRVRCCVRCTACGLARWRRAVSYPCRTKFGACHVVAARDAASCRADASCKRYRISCHCGLCTAVGSQSRAEESRTPAAAFQQARAVLPSRNDERRLFSKAHGAGDSRGTGVAVWDFCDDRGISVDGIYVGCLRCGALDRDLGVEGRVSSIGSDAEATPIVAEYPTHSRFGRVDVVRGGSPCLTEFDGLVAIHGIRNKTKRAGREDVSHTARRYEKGHARGQGSCAWSDPPA